jgi:predicted ester cyclase
MSLTEKNKTVVTRFNKEFIEGANMESFKELVSPDFVNRSAPHGVSTGPDGMIYFLQHVLKIAFPDLKVIIHDQVAEGDKVTTRKSFHATHTGEFMGIPATGKKVIIDVIDIIRLHEGKYAEHWGMSNIPNVIAALSEK